MNEKLVLFIVLLQSNNFIFSGDEESCNKIIARENMDNFRLNLFVPEILTWAEQEIQEIEDRKKDPKNFRHIALRLGRAISEGSATDRYNFGLSYDELYKKITSSSQYALKMRQRIEDISKKRGVASPVTSKSPLEKVACCSFIENIRDKINNK